MSCNRIKAIEIPECLETFSINVGLPDGNYSVEIQDKFKGKYIKQLAIADNVLTIETVDYPLGLFTKYALSFTLKIFGGFELQELTICEKQYDYISFRMVGNSLQIENYEYNCE